MKNVLETVQSMPLQEPSPTLIDKVGHEPQPEVVLPSYKESFSSGSSKVKNLETTRPSYWQTFSKHFFPQDTNEVILEWWIGEVDKVYNDYFTAYMIDLKGKEIGAEFDMKSVDPGSRILVKPNAQFAYYISREDSRRGRKTSSYLVFSKTLLFPFESREALLKRAEELFGPEPDFDEE